MTNIGFAILSYTFLASSCMAEGSNQNQGLRKVFIYNDTDHDGCLSAREWRTMTEKTISLRKKGLYDSKSEVASSLEAFSQLDLNRDGCLTEAEYSTFLSS